MSKSYYVTSVERPDGWGWQVRTGAYPSEVVEHVADSAVAAHVWAEGKGYTLLIPAQAAKRITALEARVTAEKEARETEDAALIANLNDDGTFKR